MNIQQLWLYMQGIPKIKLAKITIVDVWWGHEVQPLTEELLAIDGWGRESFIRGYLCCNRLPYSYAQK